MFLFIHWTQRLFFHLIMFEVLNYILFFCFFFLLTHFGEIISHQTLHETIFSKSVHK